MTYALWRLIFLSVQFMNGITAVASNSQSIMLRVALYGIYGGALQLLLHLNKPTIIPTASAIML